MNSSGIKRGLAVSAISALAIAGVPSIASATPLAAQSGATLELKTVVDGESVSFRNDGTNTTVSLVATAPASVDIGGVITPVEFATFYYNAGGMDVLIGTSNRKDGGEFQVEWSAPVGIAAADIIVRQSNAAGTTVAGGLADTVTGVTLAGNAAAEITPRAELGYFPRPTGAAYPNTDFIAGVSGTVSRTANDAVATNPDVAVETGNSLGIDSGVVVVDNAAQAADTSTTWSGSVVVNKAAVNASTTDVDQVLVTVTANTQNRDGQGFSLYRQEIRGISGTAGNFNSGTGTAPVTLKVVDQRGNPVAGARVNAVPEAGTSSPGTEGGDAFGFTNGRGEVTFINATTGSHSYFVDADGNEGNTNGVDYVASVTVGAPRPTTIEIVSQDGLAFDIDEYDAGAGDEVRVVVKDAAGNPIIGERFFYTWNFNPFDKSTGDTQQTTSQKVTEVTDAQGRANVPLPAAADFPDPTKVTTLLTTGGTFTLNGYVNRDNTAPGQDAADLGLAATQFKIGESDIDWDAEGTTDRQQGTTQTFTGTLTLRDGTVLPNRQINVAYTPGTAGTGNSALAATQPAGTTRLSSSSAQVVTDASGAFAVAVTDPATPAANELGALLRATGPVNVGTAPNVKEGIGVDAGPEDVSIDWDVDAVGAGIVLVPDSDDSTLENDPFNELIDNVATPGRPVSFRVQLNNSQGQPLAGQQVTLTTDKGFFTPNPGATGSNATIPAFNGVGSLDLTADPAPAEGGLFGEWASLGQSVTVNTNASGIATVTIAIERDAGFDDDGRVRSVVTATSGAATNSTAINVDWSTQQEALNPGSVEIVAADEDDQVRGLQLPRARAGLPVAFDVFAKDQFGNLVEDDVVVSDDTNLVDIAGQAGNGTVTVSSQFTSDDPTVEVETRDLSVEVDQVLTASWTQPSNRWTDGNAPLAGFQGVRRTDTTNVVEADADAVEWYAVDFADVDFTLTSDRTEPVRAGQTVTVTAKAVDSDGIPIQGLDVEFLRTGPGDQENGSDLARFRTTNANGEAFYSFTSPRNGDARISAVFTNGEQTQTIADTITFGGVEPIVARLTGNNNGGKADRLQVSTGPAADGATVRLFRVKKNGDRTRVGVATLSDAGTAAFRVADRNGRKFTRYVAVVRPTADTLGENSNIKRVR